MSQNQFWRLLAAKLSGEASADELIELEGLMKANPNWVYEASYLEEMWKTKPLNQNDPEIELGFEQLLNNLNSKGVFLPGLDPLPYSEELPVEDTPVKKRRYFFLSAAIVVCMAVAYLMVNPNSPTPPAGRFSEVSTQRGSRSKLLLPDSTIVWLNAGSKLTYSENFGQRDRNTTLSGEAFFDVKKSNIPFVIQTNTVKVKVLGTAFNVKSYPDEKMTETSVIRGSVEVTINKQPHEKFTLKPNRKLVVANEPPGEKIVVQKNPPIAVLTNLTQHESDQTIIETSWVDNRLVFQNETFGDIARRMERWYDLHITIKDEQLAKTRLTGSFKNETVNQALNALQMTTPFRYTIHEKEIILLK